MKMTWLFRLFFLIILLNGYHEHDTETEISNYRVVFLSYTLIPKRTKLSCKFMQKYFYFFYYYFSFSLNIKNSEIVKR